MALMLDLTNRVPSACYTKRVGVSYLVTAKAYHS